HHSQLCTTSEYLSYDSSADEEPSSEDSSSEEYSAPGSSSFFSLVFFSLAWLAASCSSSKVVGSLALSSSLTMRSYFPGAKSSSVRLQFLRSEEHTSELQSRFDLVCRLLLEKKKKMFYIIDL